jgi:hypothetical protein
MLAQAFKARPLSPATASSRSLRAAGEWLDRLLPAWPEESIAVPSPAVILAVDRTLALLAAGGPAADRLLPALEGGVSIVFERGRRYADLTFLNSGDVAITLSPGAGEPRPARTVAHPPLEGIHQIRDFLASPIC